MLGLYTTGLRLWDRAREYEGGGAEGPSAGLRLL